MKMTEKSRDYPGFSLLANDLGISVRTLRRWITEQPNLRPVLRAKRHGKQWRIDYPKTIGAYDVWVQDVQRTVGCAPSQEDGSGLAQELVKDLGLADAQGKRQTEILRQAMLLRRLDVVQYVSPHENKEYAAQFDGERSPKIPCNDFRQWESAAAVCRATARTIAARFNCSIKDALLHWQTFLTQRSQENREKNVPMQKWLNEHGLCERAKELLAKKPGAVLRAYIGKPRMEGKPRIKLYRLPFDCREGKITRLRTVDIQLLPVAEAADIEAECERVAALWPERKHWDKAEADHKKGWQLKTLAEAALELARADKAIIGPNLAPLLFLNPAREDCWRLHQRHVELQKQGIDVFPNEKAEEYGRRGISLRLFRQRYTRREIQAAERKAHGTLIGNTPEPIDDIDVNLEEDERVQLVGQGVLNESGSPAGLVSSPEDYVTPRTARRVRRELTEAKDQLNSLAPEERRNIEAALGRSLEEYQKAPFKEDFPLA